MASRYGFILDELQDDPSECQNYLSKYLNKGYLGLLLGAGASKALNLPSWSELVVSLAKEHITGFVDKGSYSNSELKQLTQKIKRNISPKQAYLDSVKNHLYKGVSFDFHTANKELLIALGSLIVGKYRGNVENIITYNFDSVLEWYLSTNGLKVDVISKSDLLFNRADVHVTHIHGYLPHDDNHERETDLIFAEEEFVDRMMEENNYWKDHLYEYFRKHVFLSVGLSASSLVNDVRPYLRNLDKWYDQEKVNRGMPYGIAFISTDSDPEDQRILLEQGIITCRLEHDQVPATIFGIAQRAIKPTV